jgi:hypothetical protein
MIEGLVEGLRLGLFISSNLAPAPCNDPVNMVETIKHPVSAARLYASDLYEGFQKVCHYVNIGRSSWFVHHDLE